MRKATWFAAVSILMLGILVVAGCGKLSKEEFNQIFSEHETKQAEKFAQVDSSITALDSKVDQQISALKESTQNDIAAAKNEVLAAVEQGDADTIETAKAEDKKVLKQAQKYADRADSKLREAAMKAAKEAEKNAKAAAQAAAEKAEAAGSTASKALALAKEADAKAQKALKAKPVKVAVVYFATAKATLTDEAKAELDAAIGKIPAGAVVKVFGHADGRPVIGGKYRSNWDLSEARAQAVKDYLVSKGVSNTIEVEARAHTEPVAPTYSKEGRKLNRRAEVWVYPM